MVGGLLIAIASLGVFVSTTIDGDLPTTTFAVATRPLAAGEVLAADDVQLVPADLSAAQAATLSADLTSLEGAVVLAPIARGAFVPVANIRAATPGLDPTESRREVALALPPSRAVAGTLRAGDLVDVLATSGTGAGARTDVVVSAARVVAATRRDGGGFGSTDDIVVTLAVRDGREVLAAVHANEAATATVVLATNAADELPDSYVLPNDERFPLARSGAAG